MTCRLPIIEKTGKGRFFYGVIAGHPAGYADGAVVRGELPGISVHARDLLL